MSPPIIEHLGRASWSYSTSKLQWTSRGPASHRRYGRQGAAARDSGNKNRNWDISNPGVIAIAIAIPTAVAIIYFFFYYYHRHISRKRKRRHQPSCKISPPNAPAATNRQAEEAPVIAGLSI